MSLNVELLVVVVLLATKVPNSNSPTASLPTFRGRKCCEDEKGRCLQTLDLMKREFVSLSTLQLSP